MNSIEYLRELFTYNDWANRRMITALKNAPSEKGRKLLAHVLVAESEYFERMHGKDSTGFDFWPDLSLEDLSKLARENAENYEMLLNKFDDEGLGQNVKYYTSGGDAVNNTFREMLTQVLLHSMNHRGQVNAAIRADGFTPPWTDYIIYCREVR